MRKNLCFLKVNLFYVLRISSLAEKLALVCTLCVAFILQQAMSAVWAVHVHYCVYYVDASIGTIEGRCGRGKNFENTKCERSVYNNIRMDDWRVDGTASVSTIRQLGMDIEA